MKSRTKYNDNILAIALKRQEKLQRTVGTNWWFKYSKTHRFFKIVYYVAFIATLILNFFVVSGVAYWRSRANDDAVAAAQGQFIAVFIICSLVLAAAVIISGRLKKIKVIETEALLSRISCILVVLSSVLMMFSAYDTLIIKGDLNEYATSLTGGESFSKYMQLIFYHVIPLLLISLAAVLLHVMRRCNIKEINYIYEKLVSNLYKDYVEANPDYTEEMWLKYLNEYKDEEEEIKPLKRSKRAQKRKTKEDKE